MAGMASVCAFVPARAAATESEDFANARSAYHRGDYSRAVELFEAMVGGPTPAIRDAVLIQESREYLAAAYVLLGQRDRAADQFEALLRAEPDLERYRLDPAAFPQAVLDVFSEVHRRLMRERQEDAENRRRRREAQEARRREATLRLIDLAATDEVVIEHDPALAWVPFGAGQFQNGNSGLGTFFLVAESLSVLTAVATLAVWLPLEDLRNSVPASDVDIGVLRALQLANWASTAAFGVLAVAGIIEALVNYVPSHTVRREREIPTDILENLDLSVGPGTIGLRLRF